MLVSFFIVVNIFVSGAGWGLLVYSENFVILCLVYQV